MTSTNEDLVGKTATYEADGKICRLEITRVQTAHNDHLLVGYRLRKDGERMLRASVVKQGGFRTTVKRMVTDTTLLSQATISQ